MTALIVGLVVFGGTAAIFWYYLPRPGKTHWFIGTEYEAYIGAGICTGLALGLTLIGVGIGHLV